MSYACCDWSVTVCIGHGNTVLTLQYISYSYFKKEIDNLCLHNPSDLRTRVSLGES